MHLCRRPVEPPDPVLVEFYQRLLDCLRCSEVRDGRWQLLDCRAAWEGNVTWERFIVFFWQGKERGRVLVAVNYGPARGQGYVRLPFDWLKGKQFLLRDLMGQARYDRNGNDLTSLGLYLDVPEWGYNVFEIIET
jgi:hypothetical protein